MPGVADIQKAVEQASGAYHRLVLVVGPTGSGKTGLLRSFAEQAGRDCRNVNLEISQRMLELTKLRRPTEGLSPTKSQPNEAPNQRSPSPTRTHR